MAKLSKSGLSEDFILNLIDQQGSHLDSDVSSLIELKRGGVNELIIEAVVIRSPPQEIMNTDPVLRMVRAGVSEPLLALPVRQGGGGREIASGTQVRVRMIDSIDSERRASLESPITIGDEVMIPRSADAKV